MIVSVEALIKGTDSLKSATGGYAVGDVIVILPAEANWGTGDLQAKHVVCLDLDLPCGGTSEFFNCKACAHNGVDWQGKKELKEGDQGLPILTCPSVALTSPDVIYIYHLDLHGFPFVENKISKKRRARFKVEAKIDPATIASRAAEASVSVALKDSRLLDTRLPINKVSAADFEVKA